MDWLRAFRQRKDDEDQDHERLLVAEEEIHAERHGDHVLEQELERDWDDGFLTIILLLTIILFAYSIVLYWQARQIIATDTKCTKRMSGYCQSSPSKSHSQTDILDQLRCLTR